MSGVASRPSWRSSSAWWLAAAIVIAGGLIGLGLFFGLRARDSDPVPATHPSASSARSKARESRAQLEKRVAKQAAAELEKRRPIFVAECWKPAVAANPTPSRANYTFSLSFDPRGKENGRGISESRDALRTDVAACLRKQPLDLKLPTPPGVQVSVEVPFTLP